ncbi:MAG: hypothetical protein ABI557_05015 [Aureliella sp.]
MGIRFRCHHCETELHVKDFQAGKRGRCPDCGGKFRIPATDAPHSLEPDASVESESGALGRVSVETSLTAAPSEAGSSQSLDQVKQEPVPDVTQPAAFQPPQAQLQQPALPQALQSDVESKWYVRPPSGGQFGPAPSPVVWQWLGENRVGRDALVWCEGWPEWLIAENVFDDYFHLVDQDSPSVSVPQPAAVETVTTSATTTPSLSDRNRAGRKQKRRSNYTMMIAVLTVVMLLLVGALIVVLMRQPT